MTATQPLSTTLRTPSTPALQSRDDLRRRITAKVLEKCDPVRVKHKPISLVRQEARRLGEQLLDAEAPAMTRSERESVLDDVLCDVPGLGPLDELFRDESLREFAVLAHNQVIRRQGENWLPTSVQFRDAEHYRRTLARYAETAEAVGEPCKGVEGGFDVKLACGFRMIAVVPPAVMEQPPLASFHRIVVAPSATVSTPAPRVLPPTASGTVPLAERSGAVSFSARPAPTGTSTQRMLDPWDRAKLRITERFVQRLSANGVYDISTVSSPDLKRVISAMVVEANDYEKLHLDHLAQERMTLEIMAHMNR